MLSKTTRRRAGLGSSMLFFALFCTVFISTLGAGHVFAWTCTSDPPDLCTRYQEAVQDAAGELTVGKLYNDLTPIIPENKNLIWGKDANGDSVVLVAAYTKADKYGNPPFFSCQPGVPFPKECTMYGAWVTVVPELFDFFKKTPFTTLRIEQLLGLPPNYGNDYIVEYWVKPQDLFRPGKDPQIVYREGTLQFPWGGRQLLSVNTLDGYKTWDDYCPNIPDGQPCSCELRSKLTPPDQYSDYQCWFNTRREWVYSYDLKDPPYPWTGMGYTYDWGNPKSTVGLSEFVMSRAPINGPFNVTVQSVTGPAANYFKRGQKATLTVKKAGAGTGTVTSRPGGINCGARCLTASRGFAKYSDVTLIAKPSANMAFYSWSGACEGSASATCTIAMSSDITATVTFVTR
jgi:hypothetical protein